MNGSAAIFLAWRSVSSADGSTSQVRPVSGSVRRKRASAGLLRSFMCQEKR